MLALKALGAIDLASALSFFLLVFGIQPYTQFLLFCAGLLMLKGLFVFTGDVLGIVDVGASILLTLAIFFTLPTVLLWIPAFILMAKGLVRFT